MDNSNNIKDLIPLYLGGELDYDKRAEFEKELAENPELLEEFTELREIFNGLTVMDEVSGDHVGSEVLALYAEDLTQLDTNLRGQMEKHLAKCKECQEVLETCRETVRQADDAGEEAGPSWLQKLADFILPPRLVLRPALAYMTIVVVAIGGYLVSNVGQGPVSETRTFSLSSAVLRGDDPIQTIGIDKATRSVVLEFMLPTRENHSYDLTVLDSNREAVVTFHNRLHSLPFAIEIPTEYLQSGRYILNVSDQTGADVTTQRSEDIEVFFNVEMAE